MRIGRILSGTLAVTTLLAGAPGAMAADWRVPRDFPSIQAALDSAAVKDGDTVLVWPGRRAGATVTKAVTIRALAGAAITDGPSPFGDATRKAGFYFPGNGAGSGAAIEGFFFNVPYPVFSRGANDVAVTRNQMASPTMGVGNWARGSWGNGWVITQNVISGLRARCGDGIGILVGDFLGGAVQDNVIAYNSIEGRVRVPNGDCGGYNAPGILLFADFRDGAPGASVVQRNRITRNSIRLSSSAPALVTTSAVELADTRNDPGQDPVVKDNWIVYNELGGTVPPFLFTPASLEAANVVVGNRTGPCPAQRQSAATAQFEGGAGAGPSR